MLSLVSSVNKEAPIANIENDDNYFQQSKDVCIRPTTTIPTRNPEVQIRVFNVDSQQIPAEEEDDHPFLYHDEEVDNGDVGHLEGRGELSQQPLLITDTNNRLATNNNKVDTSHNNGGTPLLPENVPLCVKQHCDLNLALYQDEYSGAKRQNIGQMLRSLSLYNSILPTSNEDPESTIKGSSNGANGNNNNGKNRNGKPQAAAKLGTIMGVYIPCLQNIFGVLFFIRLPWIVGTAGVLEAFLVVLLCCSVTFLTSISLSAIATNGVVSGGGPYYMISRNLGPELGGAVGILFYLGTTIAASMYIIGAVEIFLIYIMPQAKVFDDMYHNFRLFGSILLILVGLIVLAGIVNKFALPAVLVVIACIVCTFVGIFLKFGGTDSLKFCMVGNRPVDLSGFHAIHGYIPNCTDEGLRNVFCMKPTNNNKNNNNLDTTTIKTSIKKSFQRNKIVHSYAKPAVLSNCDRYFERVVQSNPSDIRMESAIPGLSSGVFYENLYSKYRRNGDVLTKLQSKTPELPPDPNNKQNSFWVFSDTTTSFMILVGVFFPSVTGIMAGSNRSGNLRDASKSIPVGTLGAQLTTSIVYLTGAVLIGSSVAEMFIRDKFGQSAMGKLVIAELAIPHPLLILIGCCSSTIGAGMQSLTGAPRLLQAISADDVIPFLRPFQKTDRRGEPIRAIFLTLCICWLGILIAVIENITALITQFFLMCYLGVNAACALQSLLKAPGWRPSFRYFHWSLSTLGAFLCIAVMFISAWYFALVAIFIGAAVYKYIEYAGAEKEWGDGLKGLALSAARFALLNVDSRGIMHTRNWRPQILVLYPSKKMEQLYSNLENTRKGLLAFVAQLKAGKGLTLIAECIEGQFAQISKSDICTIKEELQDAVKESRIRGFCDVLVTEHFMQGISHLIQTSGLGGLRHNSVVCAWPEHWSVSNENQNPMKEASLFAQTVRTISAANCAILVPKYASNFPTCSERLNGTIDIYWVVNDGGLLMLIPFLLIKNKVVVFF
ncbi:unnamed protein product [Meloidogyne enterolobii]|uniref:Uncharacterized protein n=1 Tax=Meloidogyne enterolobii TaxID=390850 RepID=A0ACB1A5G8_MELEN